MNIPCISSTVASQRRKREFTTKRATSPTLTSTEGYPSASRIQKAIWYPSAIR